jgi:hypothetical protein
VALNGTEAAARRYLSIEIWSKAMKRLFASVAVLVLSSGLTLAQSGGGGGSSGSSGGASGSSSSGNAAAQSASPTTGTTGSNAAAQQQPSGAGSSATPGSAVNGPNNTGGPVPGLSTTQPSDNLTVGRAPGVNPANPQDASRRGNPSDRTLTGARNPQDMKAFDNGVPQIIKPEPR